MLSLSTLKSSAQAATYYKGKGAGDYYAKGQAAGAPDGIGGPDGGAPAEGAGMSAGTGPVTGADLRASAWFGAGAVVAGLSGEVDQDVFRSVLEGQVPGGPLLGRFVRDADGAMQRQHVPGIDLTFSAPKSVSVLALVKGDRDIINAHEDAVRVALSYLEKNVLETRKSVDGVMTSTRGQDMVVALFREEASRNLEPQMHTHAVVANMVRDADGTWRSLHNPSIYDNKMLLGQIYRASLAKSLTGLGYEVERSSEDGLFEVVGVPRDLRETFSTRRQEIKAQLRAWGRADATAAANAAVSTRRPKQAVGPDRLMEAWRLVTRKMGYDLDTLGPVQERKAEPSQLAPIPMMEDQPVTFMSRVTSVMVTLVERWRAIIGTDTKDRHADPLVLPEGIRRDTAIDAVLYGLADMSERSSVFSLSNLKAAVLSSGLGRFSLDDVDQAVAGLTAKGVILPALHPEMARAGMVTTSAALATEQETLRLIEEGQGAVKPLAAPDVTRRSMESLGVVGEARAAAELIVTSTDRFVGLQGWAGTGKSTLFQAVRDVVAGQGKRVLALAPQTSMVRRLEEDGFDARTVASFLTKFGGVAAGRHSAAGLAEMRARMKDTVLLVDEAGRLSAAQMRDLNRVASSLRLPRVVYAGDVKQLGAIEAGAPFGQAQAAGMTTARLTDIRRQQTLELRDAVYASIDGNVAQAFRLLGQGRIVEAKADLTGLAGATAKAAIRDQIAAVAVETWSDLTAEDRAETVVIAPSNATRAAVTSRMRDVLKREGGLRGVERSIDTLVNVNVTRVRTRVAGTYSPGQVVAFARALKHLGIAAGDQLEVLRVDAAANRVELKGADGKSIRWDPDGRDVRRGEAVQLYERRSLALMAGDRIRWTAKDTGRRIDGGAIGTVERIDDKVADIRLDDGRRLSFEHAGRGLQHIDHDHVQTTFRAQGLTATRVILALNSRERRLNSIQNFYVNLSRARLDVRLIVDDRHAAVRAILANSGEKVTALESRTPGEVEAEPSTAVPPALAYAIAHLSEREAVFCHDDILEAALQAGFGHHDIDDVQQGVTVAVREGGLIPAGAPPGAGKTKGRDGWYTTPQALVAEKAALDHVRRGRGAVAPLLDQAQVADVLARHVLNAEQAGAAGFAMTSPDRYVGIQGLAGVGKTTMTRAVVDGIDRAGYRPLGMAPSTAAVKELSDGAGIEAVTLQSFLLEFGYVARGEASPAQVVGLRDEFERTVLIVDESSMPSNRQMADLVRITEAVGARMVMLGDVKQLRGVEAGRPFDLLQKAGMATFRMTNIQRQTNEDLKAAVYDAAEGRVTAAMAKVGMDNIVQVGGDDEPASRLEIANRIAADWLALPSDERAKGKVMIVAPARFTRDAINAGIHEGLTQSGEVSSGQVVIRSMRNKSFTRAETTLASNYQVNDVVRFVSGLDGAAIGKDEYLTVERVNQTTGTVVLRKGDRVIDWKPGDSNHRAKVAVYEVAPRPVGAGERIRWTDTDKDTGTINGRSAEVVAIEGNTVHVRLDDGRLVTFHHSDPALRHMDYDYARTVYASQGATTVAVWGALSMDDNKLANQQLFYVLLSRSRLQAKLYVDGTQGLAAFIEKQTGAASSALQGVGHPISRENDILDRWIGSMGPPSAGLGKAISFTGSRQGQAITPHPAQQQQDIELSL